MILASDLMSLDQAFNEIGIENTTRARAVTQNVFINHPCVCATKPTANWNRKAHLRTREYRFRQNALHAFSQNVFCSPASEFQTLGQTGGKLNELMIQKGHATLNRGCHTHLVLFHQQFLKIGLYIGVK